MRKTYKAIEPKKECLFVSEQGTLFHDRDEALKSNFNCELRVAVQNVVLNTTSLKDLSPLEAIHFLREFAEFNPDMLRVLIGDMDIN